MNTGEEKPPAEKMNQPGRRKHKFLLLISVLVLAPMAACWFFLDTNDREDSLPRHGGMKMQTSPVAGWTLIGGVLDTRITPNPDQHISEIMELEELSGLVVGGPTIGDRELNTLLEHPTLKMLVLDSSAVSEATFESLSASTDGIEIVRSNRRIIQSLREQHVRVREQQTRRWEVRKPTYRNPDIHEELARIDSTHAETVGMIDMSNCAVTPSMLKNLTSFNMLERLILGYHVDDSMLNEIVCLDTVTRLDLAQTLVTDAGTERLHELPNLERLVLSRCMTDVTAQHLAKIETLKEIDCRYSQIGDEGVIALSKLTTLEGLNLGGLAITDKSVAAFAEHPAIARLELRMCNNLTDNAIQFIKEMPALELVRAPLSRQALAELARTRPMIKQ